MIAVVVRAIWRAVHEVDDMVEGLSSGGQRSSSLVARRWSMERVGGRLG